VNLGGKNKREVDQQASTEQPGFPLFGESQRCKFNFGRQARGHLTGYRGGKLRDRCWRLGADPARTTLLGGCLDNRRGNSRPPARGEGVEGAAHGQHRGVISNIRQAFGSCVNLDDWATCCRRVAVVR
jgi:hypothetical protein